MRAIDSRQQTIVDHLLATHHQAKVVVPEALAAIGDTTAGMASTVAELGGELRALAVLLRESNASNAAQLTGLRDDVDRRLRSLAVTASSIALQISEPGPIVSTDEADDDPLVSIVVATHQRAHVLGDALRSVQAQTYTRWECVVVDDGSTDDTAAVFESFGGDGRFRLLCQDRRGAAAARNAALTEVSGSIIAYLDSDDVMMPSYLARVVAAFREQPDKEWTHAAQVVVDDAAGQPGVRDTFVRLDSARRANFVDLNALAHRRAVVAALAPNGRFFDEELRRLSDWDLVLRLAQRGEPIVIPQVGSLYLADQADRISSTEPLAPAQHAVRTRQYEREGRSRPAEGLRLLMAEWHFPQLTESYIRTHIEAMQDLGATVEVWSEERTTSAPFATDVPVRHGDLADAVAAFQPNVVMTHWTHKAEEFLGTVPDDVLYVVRTHGFDFDPERSERLLGRSQVVLHTFPHMVDERWREHPRLVVTPSMFSERRYRPVPPADKDRRLVLRTAAGLNTKDLTVFLKAANECPDHRFVLVLGHAQRAEFVTDELIELAAQLGSLAEIRTDLQHDEMAQLMARAGIYLHTHGTEPPMGMSISIAEASATGCFVVARDLPGAAAYVGAHGGFYDGESEDDRAAAAAAVIRATAHWSDDEWARRSIAAIDWAWANYASHDVGRSMLEAWKATRPSLPIVASSPV